MANDYKYKNIIAAIEYDGNRRDISRRFHLNMAADTTTEYRKFDDLFSPFDADAITDVEECVFYQTVDAIKVDDFSGFSAPAVYYLSREIVVPEDRSVFLQIGHTAPFECWLNGELLAKREHCDTWTAENVHLDNVKLNAGVNKMMVRLTRVNADAKFNFTIAKGTTCAEHYVDNVSVRPEFFGKVK